MELLRIIGLMATGLPWLAIGSLVAGVFGHSNLPLIAVPCALLALTAMILFASTVNLYFACRARKPTEGQTWALLSLMVTGAAAVAFVVFLTNVLINTFHLSENTSIAIGLVIVTISLFILSRVMWGLSLRFFKRLRYGDIEAAGKGAS